MPRITVLLADDNRAVLTDLREELSKESSIAGMVDNGEEAVRDVYSLDPDILVLDISMPGLSGIQVAVVKRRPALPIASLRVGLKNYADVSIFEQELSSGLPPDCVGSLRGVLWHRCDGFGIVRSGAIRYAEKACSSQSPVRTETSARSNAGLRLFGTRRREFRASLCRHSPLDERQGIPIGWSKTRALSRANARNPVSSD